MKANPCLVQYISTIPAATAADAAAADAAAVADAADSCSTARQGFQCAYFEHTPQAGPSPPLGKLWVGPQPA